MKVSVLGPGRWGSFNSWYLNKIGHDVCLWGLNHSAAYQNFLITRKNDYVELPTTIEMTTDLDKAMNHADYIIISISAQAVRDLMTKINQFENFKDKKFILCMKGIEISTGCRLSQVLEESGIDENNIAVWVGPGHIQAFVKGQPNCMLIDAENKSLVKYLADGILAAV